VDKNNLSLSGLTGQSMFSEKWIPSSNSIGGSSRGMTDREVVAKYLQAFMSLSVSGVHSLLLNYEDTL